MRMAPQSYFILVCYIISFVCCPLCLVSSSQEEDSSHSDDAIYNLMKRTGHGLAKHASNVAPQSSLKTVNVDDFGAKGNASDDSEAFQKAWKEACSSNGAAFVVPPRRVYHLKPNSFEGPCKPRLRIMIYGTIKASPHRSDYKRNTREWLVFQNLTNVAVGGGGTINGNGKKWWQHSCKINKTLSCTHAPTALTFDACKNIKVENLRIKNAQQMHLVFQNSKNVKASNLRVIAPRTSPNTDGIHITGSKNVEIFSSVVRTGDDCVSIVSGSKNIIIKDLICGPGHGISIGSLGKGSSSDYVSNVLVDRARLTGTTNGVRIKTWQGGSGYAKNIRFQNIVMHNVSNPIIIDQNYCDKEGSCPEQKSAVQVEDVIYRNIKGTSATEDAITLNCSKSIPCRRILMQNIDLRRQGEGDSDASCIHVTSLLTRDTIFPQC
ncbi:Polygalacturonase [Heracleum sosnowskyi]|uniref:endo-polygalacturonase n=1 Tax=Heracleum sosnowskyi TaxID=360622 RepID=A0AAD8JBB5_9APIA|nr:Polygalacturonase [Heracleum sosnowskyi]